MLNVCLLWWICLITQDKQNLADIIQMLHQAKARQQSVQSDANSLAIYPEYILPYLVHALAHNSCPNVDECKDVETYDNLYRYYFAYVRPLLLNTYLDTLSILVEKEKFGRGEEGEEEIYYYYYYFEGWGEAGLGNKKDTYSCGGGGYVHVCIAAGI